MEKNTGLFLVREGVPTVLSPGLTWLVLRNYDEFTVALYEYIEEHHEFPPLIVLTNNLADEHGLWFQNNIGGIPQFDKFRNKSGMHALSFLMQLSDMIKLPVKKLCINGTSHANMLLVNVYNSWRKEAGHLESIPPAINSMDWMVKKEEDVTKDRGKDNQV